MKATWRLGRLAGVEIGVHWSVVVIVALIVSSLGAGVLPEGVDGTPPLRTGQPPWS